MVVVVVAVVLGAYLHPLFLLILLLLALAWA